MALVVPGVGYSPAMPLLFWTGRTLNLRGWTVQELWWYDRTPPREGDWPAWVRAAVTESLDHETRAREFVLIGKSLGSLAIPVAVERQIPGIWLTPLLNQDVVRAAVTGLPAPTLLVGGTSDPTWDGQVARTSGHQVCEIEGGDHGLEVPAGPVASVLAFADVVRATEDFADQLTRSVGT